MQVRVMPAAEDSRLHVQARQRRTKTKKKPHCRYLRAHPNSSFYGVIAHRKSDGALVTKATWAPLAPNKKPWLCVRQSDDGGDGGRSGGGRQKCSRGVEFPHGGVRVCVCVCVCVWGGEGCLSSPVLELVDDDTTRQHHSNDDDNKDGANAQLSEEGDDDDDEDVLLDDLRHTQNALVSHTSRAPYKCGQYKLPKTAGCRCKRNTKRKKHRKMKARPACTKDFL